MTARQPAPMEFLPLGTRPVLAQFDGGAITSDAGALLLREVADKTGLLRRFAACFTDHRDPGRIEHAVLDLVSQRVYGLALGYEDLTDHDDLRHDPLLAVLVGKQDPIGQDRARDRDQGKALAGKSTLNRLELTPPGAGPGTRYKKVVARCAAIADLLVETFVQAQPAPPAEVVLDLDATDDPLHGHQLGRFFHGYYRGYCYLPLYIFCGEHLLCAELRPADLDASAGAVRELARIVAHLRRAWPDLRVVIRGDSGFCREALMAWCEANRVDYLLGLAKNARLVAEISAELEQARQQWLVTRQPARVFKDLAYRTRGSWSRERRVVAKAEHLDKGPNPRFVVTSLSSQRRAAQALYEEDYCGRGDMENRIKEQQLYLFADRTSCATMRANQLRLYFSSIAYLLLSALRRHGLRGTVLAGAQCQTIRQKLFKVGAWVRVTVRRVWLALSQSYPYQGVFAQVLMNVRGMAAYHWPGVAVATEGGSG